MKINPDLLALRNNIITFAGRRVKCDPSTFMFNQRGVAECSAEILGGEFTPLFEIGKQTTVVGLAARVACNK